MHLGTAIDATYAESRRSIPEWWSLPAGRIQVSPPQEISMHAASTIASPFRTAPAAVVMQGATPRSTDEPHGITLRLAKSEELFAEGEAAEYFYKVVSGTVRTYKLLSDGRRQIDAFHLAGDIFGIEAGAEHRFSAEAVGDATVAAFRRNSLERLTRDHAAFGAHVLSSMLRNLERAQEHMLLLGRKNAKEKIASFLLDLAGRMHESEHVELPMLRNDIADHLGLTIETVSRTLTELARTGLIRLVAGSRSIVLVDKAGLEFLNA
jgi:CRP/FNR family nitrogen fixation transcriptional regulator